MKRKLQLNHEQREGLAKECDNLATAILIAAIVGGVVDHKVGWRAAILMMAAFVALIFLGVNFRKEGEYA